MGATTNATLISSFIFHTTNGSWTDITDRHSCQLNVGATYSCAILHSDTIIVSIVSQHRIICLGHYSLNSLIWLYWTNINELVKVNFVSDAKLLRSEKKEFVTYVISSYKLNTSSFWLNNIETSTILQVIIMLQIKYELITA